MEKDEILEEERLLNKKRVPDVIRRTRILHVKDFFETNTDENRTALMWEILKYLEEHGIPAEAKAVRDDIFALREYGMDIELVDGKQWRLLGRDFELAEIKLIIDCITSSKFLSEKKSNELIEKLENLLGFSERRSIDRQVVVSGRVKSINREALYSLDKIHEAISRRMCVDFQYFQYNMEKKRELKHNGKIYHVYPLKLLYDNNNYYLFADIGNLELEMKTFRVDRMTNVTITEGKLEDFFALISENVDTVHLSKTMFGMFHGEETEVRMIFKKDMMNVVIDKFGEEVRVEKVDDEHFRVITKVIVSPQFFGWIFGLGDNVMIEYPLIVAKQMKDLLKERHKAYREEHSGAIYNA